MILLLVNDDDSTANEVVDWLIYLNKDFLRINSDTLITEVTITLNGSSTSLLIQTKDCIIDFATIKSVWWRGFFLSIEEYKPFIDESNINDISTLLFREQHSLEELIHYIFEVAPIVIGSYFKYSLNKNIVLIKAMQHGFIIPDTLITTTNSNTLEFKKNHSIISKSIDNNIQCKSTNLHYRTLTVILEDYDINNLANHYLPTLFQKNIKKEIEIRVFYLFGQTYSMAIFSQNHSETSADFRKNYDLLEYAPYLLPSNIDTKIRSLMHDLKLNYGSIDLILDTLGNYVFLEVNPDGQFNFLSVYCNYYLEKEIAKVL